MKRLNIKTTLVYIMLPILTSLGSCKKFIEVDAPITTVNGENAYDTDANAIGVLTGIYINMSKDNNTVSSLPSTSFYCALSADELGLSNASSDAARLAYYQNELTDITTGAVDIWKRCYPYIYILNSAISGLQKSTTLTPNVKTQLLGEAYFLRAFYYFYLANLYGDVVVTTETDYSKTALFSRKSSTEAYNLIKSDLILAQQMLGENFMNGTLTGVSEERTRPNKAAATALLARVYLYLKEWNNAENESSKVIEQSDRYEIVSLDEAFLKNSKETIWAIQPVGTGTNQNTGEGKYLILTGAGLTFARPFYLNPDLLAAFEPDDQRYSSWIRTTTIGGTPIYQAYKYKIGSVNTPTVEYPIVLRLAEQYLIRAEARANQNNISGATDDLNIIRTRARGTADESVVPNLLPTISQDAALIAVMHERQTELFTEWGHRWFDLRRTGTIDAVMTPATAKKGGTWSSRDALYPISRDELINGPNLLQTQGY